MQTSDLPIPDLQEPAGTILIGSQQKRAYLFLSTSGERMKVERRNAAAHGVQDMRDFVFVLDGQRVELTYAELKARLLTPNAAVNRASGPKEKP